MADLTSLRAQITTVGRQLAAMNSQAGEDTTARRMAAQRAEIAKQQRYLDGLREALTLLTTDDPNQAIVEIRVHPSTWATVLRLATTGQAADRASIKRGVNGGTIRLNVGEDPDFGEPDARATAYRARGNRSPSMGDVACIDGRFYACASSGWDRLDHMPSIVHETGVPGTAAIPDEQG